MLTRDEMKKLHDVAGILLPGDRSSPAATSLPHLDELLASAVAALGAEIEALRDALAMLPPDLDWDTLGLFSVAHEAEFEVVSAAASGAYFMSTTVLDSIRYPHGPRRAPRFDLVSDELDSGVLDPVIARGSMVRGTTA